MQETLPKLRAAIEATQAPKSSRKLREFCQSLPERGHLVDRVISKRDGTIIVARDISIPKEGGLEIWSTPLIESLKGFGRVQVSKVEEHLKLKGDSSYCIEVRCV